MTMRCWRAVSWSLGSSVPKVRLSGGRPSAAVPIDDSCAASGGRATEGRAAEEFAVLVGAFDELAKLGNGTVLSHPYGVGAHPSWPPTSSALAPAARSRRTSRIRSGIRSSSSWTASNRAEVMACSSGVGEGSI